MRGLRTCRVNNIPVRAALPHWTFLTNVDQDLVELGKCRCMHLERPVQATHIDVTANDVLLCCTYADFGSVGFGLFSLKMQLDRNYNYSLMSSAREKVEESELAITEWEKRCYSALRLCKALAIFKYTTPRHIYALHYIQIRTLLVLFLANWCHPWGALMVSQLRSKLSDCISKPLRPTKHG